MLNIINVYQKGIVPLDLDIEFDEKHPNKPHWVWVKNFKDHPRFISIRTSQNSEYIYKVFGDFYYPIKDIPTQDVQRDLIAAVATHYDEIMGNLNPKIADFLLTEVNRLNLPKSVKILDVGAGTGITSLPFIRSGYSNITLLDVSKEMLEIAKCKAEFKNIKIVVSDIRKLDLSQKYDLIISSMVFCDLTKNELEQAIENLVKYLNRGSYIALVEDEDRKIYHEYFETISSGMAPFNEYKKFYFVGKVK